MLEERWDRIVNATNYAFQPIVNPYTGVVFGFEALIRGYQDAGFESIESLFEAAYRERVLYDVDVELRRRVLTKFVEVKNELNAQKCTFTDAIRVFYNLDTRILEMTEYRPGNTKSLLDELGLDQTSICFEVSEKQQIKSFSSLRNLLTIYKQQGYSVALDGFGVGFSGFELMYHSEPNVIKIDKHYTRNISIDKKRKLYVSQMVKMAHIEGTIVVAEGIESEDDLLTVQQVGCDFAQGFLVARPTVKVKELKHTYELPSICILNDKKQQGTDAELLSRHLESREPMLNTLYVKEILTRFQDENESATVPIIDKFNRPVGVIEERKMKKYVYSMYGKEIVQKHPISKYVTSAPVVDIHMSIEDIIQAFATCNDIDGMLVTKDGAYAGYLSARLLLETIHLKNVELARDENPLTKLPGNSAIHKFIAEALSSDIKYRLLAYIDLDNFKPFNDRFGFKVGDKAISMVADLLKELAIKSGAFIGHIGGDDFFVGMITHDKAKLKATGRELWELIETFAFSVKAFYDKDERKKGSYAAKDRFGEERVFALLGASISIIKLGVGSNTTQEELGELFSKLKKESKAAASHVAISDIDNQNTL